MQTLKKIFKHISSMKTGLAILGLIGLSSALGSGLSPDSFYKTIPFRVLLLLLLINMGFCTINQSSKFIKKPHDSSNNSILWFRQLNLIILHLGVILILIGGTINSFYGQSGQARLLQGKTIQISDIIQTKNSFSLKLNEFKIDFNKDGSPAQYYSHVTVMNKPDLFQNFSISVNNPLRYMGIKVYQHSFGYLIKVHSDYLKDHKKALYSEGDFIELTNTNCNVKVFKYIPNFDPKYGMNSKTLRPDNPRIVYSVYKNKVLLRVGLAKFGEEVKIDDNVYISFEEVQPYTVLKFKNDPGLSYAGLGGGMLITGVCLVLLGGRKASKN